MAVVKTVAVSMGMRTSVLSAEFDLIKYIRENGVADILVIFFCYDF